MSAAKCESAEAVLEINTDTSILEFAGGPAGAQVFVREIARRTIGLRCPHCESIVYSRRSKLCGVCSRELPAEFLFSPAEAARLENLLRSERLRHRKWMLRDRS